MQTRSRARATTARSVTDPRVSADAGETLHVDREAPPAVDPSAANLAAPPPQGQADQVLQLTPEALQTLIEEASARAAARAVADYVSRQQPQPPEPPQSSRRSRASSSTPVRTEPRPAPPDVSPPRRERSPPALSVADSRQRADPAPRAQPKEPGESANDPDYPLAVLPPRKSPFSMAILSEALPLGIRVESLPSFDGTGDPYEHVDDFYSAMEIYNFSDAGYCKMFRSTLKKEASKWFNQLPAGSIVSLEQLVERFQCNFSINKKRPKTASYLFTVKQQEGEPLRDYMSRFLRAAREVPHLSQDLLPEIVQRTLRHQKLKESLAGKPPVNLEELMTRAEKYIRIEETLETSQPQKRKGRDEEVLPPSRKEDRTHLPPQGFARYTPLKASRSEILVIAEQRGLIERPKKLRDNPKRQRSDKYCRFHRDRGHTTEDCYHLKIEIEKLIQRGYLQDFVAGDDGPRDRRDRGPPRRRSPPPHHQDEPRHQRPPQDNLPTAGVINVIAGGPSGGDSNNARKLRLRELSHPHHAQRYSATDQAAQGRHPPITFGQEDMEPGRDAHNDALVVSASLANFWVRKILVDSGSSADIIFYEAFKQLGVDNAQLQRVNTPLVGFSGEAVEALGEISLPLSLGTQPQRATKMIKFLVVKAPSAYNIILGRPSLNLFQAVVSTYHMKMKFPTPVGPGEAKGDQRAARECYVNSLKKLRLAGREAIPERTPGKRSDARRTCQEEGKIPHDRIDDPKRRKAENCHHEPAEELKIVEVIP